MTKPIELPVVKALPKKLTDTIFARKDYLVKIYGEKNFSSRYEEFCQLFIEQTRALPKLLDCSAVSLYASFKKALMLDLSIGSTLGEAWIIPYKGRASLQIGYRAYINKLRENGVFVSTAVLSKKEVENVNFNPLTEEVSMSNINFCDRPKIYDRNNIEAVIVSLANDGSSSLNFNKISRIFTKEELEKRIPPRSFAEDIWRNNYSQMITKTAIKAIGGQTSLVSVVSKIAEADFNAQIANSFDKNGGNFKEVKEVITEEQIETLRHLLEMAGEDEAIFQQAYQISSLENLPLAKFEQAMEQLKKRMDE